MKIVNKTSFPVMAFCWHLDHGSGSSIKIGSGETAEASGPYLGNMGDGETRLIIEGIVTCQEEPDNEKGFQVLKGKKLDLKNGKEGVTVCHCEDFVNFTLVG